MQLKYCFSRRMKRKPIICEPFFMARVKKVVTRLNVY